MDLQAAFAAALQQTTPAVAGRWYVRGGRLCVVTSATSELVRWTFDDGSTGEGTPADFRARALDEIEMPTDRGVSYLDGAWQIASAREVPAAVRIATLGQTLQRAPTDADRLTVSRWVLALGQRQEPLRSEA